MLNTQNWLIEHDNTVKEVQNISNKLNERSKYPKSSTNYSKLTASLRTQLSKLDGSINNLARVLDESSKLTLLEKNRRSNMLNELRISKKKFEQSLSDDNSSNRAALLVDFEGTSSNWNVTETDETMNVSSNQLLTQHDRIIADQDRGLETLSHIVTNQKRIATSIGNEVDRQNTLMDSMGDKMDNMNERLIKETRNIRLVDRRSATCGLWVIIVLLFIAIIAIVAIPKH